MKIAEGHTQLMPYLIVKNAAGLIDFLKNVFGGEVTFSMPRSEGSDVIAHAEVSIGEAVVMMAEATDQFPVCTAGLFIYVDDTQATYDKALANGATSIMPPAKMQYASLAAGFTDPCGNTWWPATL